MMVKQVESVCAHHVIGSQQHDLVAAVLAKENA